MLLERVCQNSNRTFEGGPNAQYCPECRKERNKEYCKKSVLRKKQGEAREIGKLDLCDRCGRPYTVMSGTQRYCPECTPIGRINAKRRQSMRQTRKKSMPAGALSARRPERSCIVVKFAARNILALLDTAVVHRNAPTTSAF